MNRLVWIAGIAGASVPIFGVIAAASSSSSNPSIDDELAAIFPGSVGLAPGMRVKLQVM